MLITGAAGAGKTWLATELMTRIAEAGEAVSGLAAAQWRDDLIAPLAGLTRFANLLEPAATAFRDIVGHHHGAVRQALTAAYQSSTYPAGSLCRTTVFRYACDDQLEADLDPTFDTPGRCLAPHHGRAADTAHWAELFRTRLSLADWKVPIPFDAIDNCDIDAVAQTGTWVRVADCPDAATFRHLMVQVKRCHADSVALRVSPSITLQSLLLYVTTVGQAEQREAPDVDDLRSALNELPGMQRAGRLALDSGCQTAQGEPGQPTRQDGGRPNHVDALIPEPDTVADRTAIQSRLPAPSLERLVGLLGGPAGLLVRCAECGSSDGRENPALPPHAIVQGVAQRRVGQTVRVVRDELPGVKETDHAGHRT
jgi:hypothetical protein